MRLIAPLFTLFCVPLIAEQTVSKVAFTESRHAIRASSPSGEVTLPVVRVQLDIHYPAGRSELGDLVVVYDSHNGHYFWRYTPLRHSGDTTSFLNVLQSGAEAVYTAQTGLVDFNWPGALYAKEHSERADSLDAAESASIKEIQRGLSAFERRGFHTDSKQVLVPLETDFDCAPLSPICGPRIKKFVSISREGDNWRLVVRNRWDQEVILDSKFNLVSTKRVPDPSKVAFKESQHAIRAFSPSGEITLPVVQVKLDLHYPGGKQEFGNLVVVQYPQSRHFFWLLARVHFILRPV